MSTRTPPPRTPGPLIETARVVSVARDRGNEFATLKIDDASGTVLWRHTVPNLSGCTGGECAYGRSIGVGRSSRVYVAGQARGATSHDATLISLDVASGTERWIERIDYGGALDHAYDLDVGSDGKIVFGASFDAVREANGDPTILGGESNRYAVSILPRTDPGECEDGVDNDGDGSSDFPSDPGCLTPAYFTESPQCNDGINNDPGQDQLVDLDDPQCASAGDPAEGCGLGWELVLLLPMLAGLRAYRRRWLSTRR